MPERKGKTENILENNGQNFFSSDENCTPRDPGISMSLKYNMKKSTSKHVTIKLLKITDKTNIKSMWRYRTHYKLLVCESVLVVFLGFILANMSAFDLF